MVQPTKFYLGLRNTTNFATIYNVYKRANYLTNFSSSLNSYGIQIQSLITHTCVRPCVCMHMGVCAGAHGCACCACVLHVREGVCAHVCACVCVCITPEPENRIPHIARTSFAIDGKQPLGDLTLDAPQLGLCICACVDANFVVQPKLCVKSKNVSLNTFPPYIH